MSELYIAHHGIKGQQWGVRNGPPYPLSSGDHSASEKKAGWKDSLKNANKKRSKIDNGNTGMSELAAIYVSSVLASLAITGVAAIANNMRVKTESNNNKARSTAMGPIKKINGAHTAEQDSAAVNPYYAAGKQYQMNCVLCSTAYELRRRGYDVEANISKIGRPMDKVLPLYFNTTKKDMRQCIVYSQLVKELNKQPEGARGNIGAGCGVFDSRHSMVWEKVGGKIIIRDTQSNKTYDSIGKSPINKMSQYPYHFMRTDDKDINWDEIRDAVVPRK